jgi:hypothetical protein
MKDVLLQLRATLHVVDDPYDLGESAWRRRFSRHLAEARSLARARAREESLRPKNDLAAAPVEHDRRPPSPALLVHLASVRDRANAARWRGVEPATRSALMSWVVRHRWARTSVEQRRAVGVALARAHWGPAPPDPKAAPGGGRYR